MEQIFKMGWNVQELVERITDLCFPPSEESQLVRSLQPNSLETLISPYTIGEVTVLTKFKRAEIRALIHEAKFHDNTRAHELLAYLLAVFLKERPFLARAMWIPVPLSSQRLRLRGYNQVLRVLEKTHLNPPLIVDTELLVRFRNTRPQTELNRSERLVNMTGVFSLPHPERLSGKDIVLIDDVITTGATLAAARGTLAIAHPRSITLLALAH